MASSTLGEAGKILLANEKSLVRHCREMILDGVPNQAGNRATLLLEAGDKTIVAGRVDVKILHCHVVFWADYTSSGQVAHKPGRKGHDIFKVGDPQKLLFFQLRVTKKTKLQSSKSLAIFPARMRTFLQLPSPPLKMAEFAMHPPPHPCTLYPPLGQRNQYIGRRSGMLPPPGGAATSANFYLAFLVAQHPANHTSTMMFFCFVKPNCPHSPSIL
jgi:hypothetical protein